MLNFASMMRNILLLILLAPVVAKPQANPNASISAASMGPGAAPMFISDINGRPYREVSLAEIEGHPFLIEEWTNGLVKFKDGSYVKNIPVQFDIHNNKLYFNRDGQRFEFIQPIKEFVLSIPKIGDSVRTLYRNGFPSVDRNTEETFYEVLTDGKFQLLRYHSKVVDEVKLYNGPEKKKFMPKDMLFALVPGQKIVKLKKDKESVLQALPDYAPVINKIVAEKKLKLKKVEDITTLFSLLNEQ
jgi:hypothetical protein